MREKQNKLFMAMLFATLALLGGVIMRNTTAGEENPPITEELKAGFAAHGLPLYPAKYWQKI